MSTQMDDIDDFETDAVDTDFELDDIQVEVGETPFSQGEADEGKPVADADTVDEDPTEDELAKYDMSVQKRIKSAHAKANAERRAKEQAMQEAKAAIEYARLMKERAAQEREQRLQYTRAAVFSGRASLENETQLLTQQIREANESGDLDKQILLQTKLNTVVQQLNGLPNAETLDRDIETARKQPLPELETPQNVDPQADQHTQQWIAQNKWFNEDAQLRQTAIQAEELLVTQYGFARGGKDTLDRISAMMRAAFPDKLGAAPMTVSPPPAAPPPPKAPAKSASTMPVMRTAPSGKKIIRLTPAQINLAHELGITPEAYAAEYAKTL
jgi:hypothetical protein